MSLDLGEFSPQNREPTDLEKKLTDLCIAQSREMDFLKSKVGEAEEVIKSVLGWRELRDTPSFPVERIEDLCKSFLDKFETRGTYYVLSNGSAYFVKDALFFISQGGLFESWGRNWRKVKALSTEHARRIATELSWDHLRAEESES